MIIILHVNDTVKTKNFKTFLHSNYLAYVIHVKSKNKTILSPMISLFLSYTCLDKNVSKISAVNLI